MSYQKTIGVDARLYGRVSGGIGRYLKENLDYIIENDNFYYVFFLSPESYDDFCVVKKNVKKVLVNFRWYSLAEQLLFPFFIWREKIDLMFYPHFNVPILGMKKFVVVIHDLILLNYPSQRVSTLSPLIFKIKFFFYKLVIGFALSQSRRIITVSDFTKNDILNNFNISSEKISVIYEGVSTLVLPEKNHENNLHNDMFLRYNINNQYLLYVGNCYPHKNIEKLIAAFLVFRKNNPNISLILVGKEDYFYKRLKQNIEKNKSTGIILTGYVSDDELRELYKKALAYVFPSLYEGFGLPPLEAMSCGCPVISSKSSCLPEILENAVLYFDANSEANMVEAMEKIAKNNDLRADLIQKGYQQVIKYSWEKSAKKIEKILREEV